MLAKIRSLFLVAFLSVFLAGCYQVDADITIDKQGLMDGTIVIEVMPESSVDVASLEFFEPGKEPNNLERKNIVQADRKAVELTFSDHPLNKDLILVSPLDGGESRFVVEGRFADNLSFSLLGISDTATYCEGEWDYDGFAKFWDSEFRVAFESGDLVPQVAAGEFFSTAIDDGGLIVWRPQFGYVASFTGTVADPNDAIGGAGIDLPKAEGCGVKQDYSDLIAKYPAPSPSASAEPEETATAEPEESASAEPEPTESVTEEPVATEEETTTDTGTNEEDTTAADDTSGSGDAGQDSDSQSVDAAAPVTTDAAAEDGNQGGVDFTVFVLLVAIVALLAGLLVFLIVNRKKAAESNPAE